MSPRLVAAYRYFREPGPENARDYEPLRELPDDPKSAMLKVMAERGYLDTQLMADLLKKPVEDVVANLEKQDLVYQDPHTGNFHTADERLLHIPCT